MYTIRVDEHVQYMKTPWKA